MKKGILLMFVGCSFLLACGDEAISSAELKYKINASALMPYDEKNFPKLFSKYGTRIKDIEEQREKAAFKAAASSKCDEVITSDLSSTKSTLEDLHYFIDCKNGNRFKRFEWSESQLKNVIIK